MSLLFYLFAAVTLFGGLGVVMFRNPVSAGFSMIVSFLGLAALFIQLNAYLVGTLQILVYAGAIMVLFLFIIMLLDVRAEERRRFTLYSVIGAGGVAATFAILLATVLKKSEIGSVSLPPLQTVEGPGNTDVHRIGELLFSHYWFPIQIVGILLLVATVGAVVLSKKQLK